MFQVIGLKKAALLFIVIFVIYKDAKLLDENCLLVMSSYRFVNNMVNNHTPSILHKKLTIPKRTCQDMTFKFTGKSFLKSYMNVGLKIFNKVPLVNLQQSKVQTKQRLREMVTRPGNALEILTRSRH